MSQVQLAVKDGACGVCLNYRDTTATYEVVVVVIVTAETTTTAAIMTAIVGAGTEVLLIKIKV